MTLLETIRSIRLRGIVNQSLHVGGLGCGVGLVAACAVLLIARLAGWNPPVEMLIALPIIGLIAGALYAVLTHPDATEVALRMDRSLRLKDRIATAHALVSGGSTSSRGPRHDAAFAEIVRRDAENLARSLDVRSLAPIRPTGVWGGVVILAVVFWLAHLFVPVVAWGDDEQTEDREKPTLTSEERAERERLRDEIEQMLAEARDEQEAEASDAETDRHRQEHLEALERLARQLQSDDEPVDIDRARDESAARMNELAETMQQQAEREAAAAEKLAERFSGMESPETPMSSREFEEALKRGDFGRAGDRLAEMLENRDQYDSDDREKMADHLEQVREKMREAGEDQQRDLEERRAQHEQMLRDLGLDDDLIEELLDAPDMTREQIEQALRQENIDQETAERLSRRLDEMRREREAAEQAERDTEMLDEALREAARQLMDEPAAPPLPPDEPLAAEDLEMPEVDDPAEEADLESAPADEADAEDERADADEERDTERAEAEREEDAERRETGDEQRADESADRGEERATDDPDAEEAASTEQREQKEDAEDEQQRRQAADEDDADQPGQEQTDADAKGEDEQSATQQGQTVDDPAAEEDSSAAATEDGEDTDAAEQPQAGEPGMDQDQDRETAPDPSAAEDCPDGQCPSSAFRQLGERQRKADDGRQSSERMRERARQLADQRDQRQTTPETAAEEHSPGEQAMGDGGDQAGTGDAPTAVDPDDEGLAADIEDLDLSPDDDAFGELVAEWLSGETVEGEPRRAGGEPSDRVRQAREIAERAVNEGAVPARYHEFIRRYFGRLNETVDDARGAGPAESPAD